MILRYLSLLAALPALVLLNACGGGGESNSGPPASVALNSSNGQYAADAAMDVVNSSDTSSSIGVFNAIDSQSGGKYGLMELTRDMLQHSHIGQSNTQPGQAVVQSGFCDNEPDGYIDVTTSGTNSGSAMFSNCQLGDVYINGGMSLIISSDTAVSTVGSMTFNNLSASDIAGVLFTINGSINFTETSNSMTISGNVLSISMGGEVMSMFNFNIYTSSSAGVDATIIYNLTVSSNVMGGSITVSTSPSEGGATIMQNVGDPYPYAGSLVLIGANNTRVRVTAMGDGSPTGIVRVEYDIDGMPNYETFEDLTWAELDAAGGN